MIRLVLSVCLAWFAWAGPAQAAERITDYDITLNVGTDGTLTVTERITVTAEHDKIKRGIYRDFPIRYRTALGFNEYVPFDVSSVTRNGTAEPHFIEPQGTLTRLYIGDADHYVARGRHVYEITYQTAEQLHFSADGTELYWNLTGNEWAFPIDRLRAHIKLPAGAEVQDLNVYTGQYGEAGNAADVRASGNRITLANRHTLAPGEGVTLSAVWQPGLVDQPGSLFHIWDFLRDNLGFVIGLASLGLIAAYFAHMWRKYGRDPETGTIIPLFTPPNDLSPVALGYIHARGFRGPVDASSALTIAVTSLAIKGHLAIKEIKKGYTLHLTKKDATDLPPGEAALRDQLFNLADDNIVTLNGTYDESFASLKSIFTKVIEREYTHAYFATNGGKWAAGLGFAALALLATSTFNLQSVDDRLLGGVLTLFFSIAFAGLIAALRQVFLHAKGERPGTSALGFTAIIVIALLAAIPALFLGIGLLAIAGLPVLLIAVPMVALTTIFFWLMEAPTIYGRQIMDQIEGYLLFLSTTEWDRFQARDPMPTPDTALFEKHLAYSMALGVGEAWSRTFAKYAERASVVPGTYHPTWYHSQSGSTLDFSGFSSRISSSMSSAFSSAATAPSSNSGSGGGGGFSGGGGGGGGGGGW